MEQPKRKELKPINKLNNQLYEMTYEATNMCIQCGYCLPVCPTYKTMGKETASPRGRINLVKQAALGKIDINLNLSPPIDLCVGCRACEAACPVGVPYGHILDSTKQVIVKAKEFEPEYKQNMLADKFKTGVFKNLFPYPKRLTRLGNLIWLYQKSGVYKLIRKTKIINKISQPLAELEKAIPILESPVKRYQPGTIIKAKGKKKAKVAFFLGCIADAMFYRANRLSIELLSLIGCEVIIPDMQNCCGALHAHQGMVEDTITLAKINIQAFEISDADYFVNNAGGCGAMLSEYDKLLKNEEEWYERAKDFVKKSKDISEVLVQYGPLPFKEEWNGIITYQDSCHLRNVQGVANEPRQLLQSIPGAVYIELEDSNICCGAGGIYNIVNFNESMKILDDKMEKVKKTKATAVVTTNPGCTIQLRLGAERHNITGKVETLHLVEVLAKACGID